MSTRIAPVAALATVILVGCGRTESTAPLAPGAASEAMVPGLGAPSNATAAASSTTQIDVGWRDNASSETGFEVHRSTSGATGPFTLRATVAANLVTWRDQGLSAQTTYCYEVRAVQAKKNATSTSAFSNVACAGTPASAPAIASVTVLPESALVIVGGVWSYRAEVRDASGTLLDVTPTWSTNAPGVATVTSSGQATGVARGRAVITATAGSASGSAKLSVLTPTRVTTTSTGNDLDADGVWVTVDGLGAGSPDLHLGANGALSVGLTGDHLLALVDLAPNCSVSGASSKAVSPSPDYDSVVGFDVRCVAAEKIAYVAVRYDEMFGFSNVLTVDFVGGSDAVELSSGASEPAWSPDGSRVAFGTGTGDIRVVNVSTGANAQLTQNAARDWAPAWSPDGARIAFASERDGHAELYVMNADGSAQVRLTNGTGFTDSPAWSPDGTRIAFDCQVVPGNTDICVVNADGSGLVRLTTDPARDSHPAWSPDGQRLAFDTDRYSAGSSEIAILGIGTGSVSRLVAGMIAERPAWSPDGTRLAFTAPEECDWGTCSSVRMISADGTGSASELFIGTDAAWRPRSPGP